MKTDADNLGRVLWLGIRDCYLLVKMRNETGNKEQTPFDPEVP